MSNVEQTTPAASAAGSMDAAAVSELQLLSAVEGMIDGIQIYDAEDRLVYRNHSCLEMLPPAFARLLEPGARFADIVRAAAAQGLYHQDMGPDYAARRLAQHRAPIEDQMIHLADGRWLRARESSIKGGGRVLILRDVTDRQQALREFQGREQLWRAIAEGVPLPVVIARIREPEVLFANSRAREAFALETGPSADAIQNAYVRPEDRRVLIELLERDGRVDHLEVQLRRADGTLMWALLSARLMSFDGAPAMLAAVTDIGEHKAMEQALRESEARFRAVVDNQSEFIIRQRPDGLLTFTNDAFCRFRGMSREAMLGGYNDLEALPEPARAQVRRQWAALSPAHPTTTYDLCLDQEDGSVRYEQWTDTAIFDRDGRLVEYQSVGRDITEQKLAEEALKASEARLAAFMENAPVGMYLKDLEGRYVLLNPEMGKVLGADIATMIGQTPAASPIGHDVAFITARDEEVRRTGRVVVTEEHTPNPDAYTWDLVIRFPIRDENGEITHIAGFDVDITARKAIEDALKASEQRFRALAEAHPVPLAIVELDSGRVLLASPACAELLGVPLDALIGESVLRFHPDPSMRRRIVETVQAEGKLDGFEVTLKRADGSVFPAAFTSRVIRFGEAAAMVTAIVDLTEQKRVQAELERQREALVQSEKMSALGSLLASVAHELNNPLSVVVGQAAMLQEIAAGTAAAERAARIRNAAERCARIVKTFLAMARSKPPTHGLVQVNDAVRAALDIAVYGLRSTGVDVRLDLQPDLPPLWADEDQLHQVLTNLIINAKQAMQSCSGPRQLSIRSRLDAAREMVVLEIKDTGPGVPDAVREQIFEPFFTTKPQGVGTGIGLSVSRRVVAAHGGEIEAANDAGGGAVFTVRLPIGAPPSVVADHADEAPAGPGRARGRVLVVDDEPDVAEVLAEILRMDGLEVDLANGGRTALERIAAHDYALVISDLRMPEMDGQTLYRELARRRPEMVGRMVFVTGDTLSPDASDFVAASGRPVIDKPFDAARVRRLAAEQIETVAPSASAGG